MHIGKNIKKIIDEKGISQATLARLLDTKPQNITNLLKTENPGALTVLKIAELINVDFNILMGVPTYEVNSKKSNKIYDQMNTPSSKTENDNLSIVEEQMINELSPAKIPDEFVLLEKTLDYLNKLGDMRENGTLTEEEFIKIKNKLVARILRQ